MLPRRSAGVRASGALPIALGQIKADAPADARELNSSAH
jgi:hypothetical protein